MKKVLVLLATLSLGGCWNPLATVTNPVSATNLYQAELVFDASLKTFNELKGLCANRTLPPACRTYVIKAQGLIPKAYAADKAARSFILNNPTLSAANAVAAFTGIVQTFQGTVTSLGATK